MSIRDWAVVVPIEIEDDALVDALSEGKDNTVEIGSTGSSNLHNPRVASVFKGAWALTLESCAPRAQ